MLRLSRNIFLIFSVLVLFVAVVFAATEEIIVTTYYPSPYGSYNSLFTQKLGVGDNSGDGFYTSADVPTTIGDVWIKGNVGIGTIAPVFALEIEKNLNNQIGTQINNPNDGTGVSAMLKFQARSTGGDQAWIFLASSNNSSLIGGAGAFVIGTGSGAHNIVFANNGAERMRIATGGNVGIGTTEPASFKLQVAGHVGPNADNTYDLGSTALRWRDVWCNRAAFNGSDARLKTNIIDTPLGLDFIMRLRPVQYNWKKENDGKHQGILAQELEAILKQENIEFAGLRYDQESDTYGLAYTDFIAPLIKAVQQQQQEIESLKAEIEKLKARSDKLKGKQAPAGE